MSFTGLVISQGGLKWWVRSSLGGVGKSIIWCRVCGSGVSWLVGLGRQAMRCLVPLAVFFDFLDFSVKTTLVIRRHRWNHWLLKGYKSLDVTIFVTLLGLAVHFVGVYIVYAELKVVLGWVRVLRLSVNVIMLWICWGGVLSEYGGHACDKNDHQIKNAKLTCCKINVFTYNIYQRYLNGHFV